MEKILTWEGVDAATVQTLLFSATLPPWVKDVTRRFFRAGAVTVDLVGSSKLQVGVCWGGLGWLGACGWFGVLGFGFTSGRVQALVLGFRTRARGRYFWGFRTRARGRRPHPPFHPPAPPTRFAPETLVLDPELTHPPPTPHHPQAATTVRHLLLPCHWTQRASLVAELVRCYGVCGRTIVFTDTKADANELAQVGGVVVVGGWFRGWG